MILMNSFSFSDLAAKNNVVPASADMDSVRSLLASDDICSWHCMLNDSDDPNNIPADSPMLQFEYWLDGGDGDRLICDMSCPSNLEAVLNILPDNTELKILSFNQGEITVWILPTYENIAEMGLDRLTFLCNSAG
jgi:hypothetical protein